MPSAPVLVPDVCGAGVPEVTDVRNAVLRAVADVSTSADASSWVVVGSDDGGRTVSDRCGRGSFIGFGVDVGVSLSDECTDDTFADPEWPTSMLVAGWLRSAAGLPLLHPVLVPATATGAQIDECAAALRVRADGGGPVRILVVADGATSLSQRAPGGGDEPAAHRLQDRIDAAIESGDREGMRSLEPGECERWGVAGRPAWQVVAAAFQSEPVTPSLYYRGAPLGVGYTVATWRSAR